MVARQIVFSRKFVNIPSYFLEDDRQSPQKIIINVIVGAAIGRQRTICKIVQISTGNNMFIAFCDTILFQNCRATNGRPYGFLRSFLQGRPLAASEQFAKLFRFPQGIICLSHSAIQFCSKIAGRPMVAPTVSYPCFRRAAMGRPAILLCGK